MKTNAKRGIAAITLALCSVAAVFLLVVGRLAADSLGITTWIGLIGGIAILAGAALWTLRRYKD